ncbi:pentapeptide repeat-containing protein, partial [Halolamina salina]|uniref:pentapeptide repeat-containing protein n=1 Tax=Halolamina salina TaxID=1220023 RepID=UPI0036151C8A
GGARVRADDLRFTDATFESDVSFERAAFRSATFERVAVGGDADFDEAVFDGDLLLTGASFDGALVFAEARCNADVALDEVAVGGVANFEGVEFRGGDNARDDDVTFADTTFEADATFENGAFEYAEFSGAVFGGDAVFQNVRFGQDTYFEGVEFRGDVDLNETRYGEDASFEGATFAGEVCFRGAEFHGGDNVEEDDVRFVDAVFESHVDYEGAQFRYVDFSGAVFHAAADFEDTVYEAGAVFESVRFDAGVWFTEARFRNDASFEALTVRGDWDGDEVWYTESPPEGRSRDPEACFRGAEFHGGDNVDEDDVRFVDAEFAVPATFHRGQFRSANFEGVEFDAPLDCSFAEFDRHLSFRDARFGASADFDEVSYDSDVCVAGATFEGPARFRGSEFTGGAYTVEDADFEGVTFRDDATFSYTEFRQASFADATFDGATDFTETAFSDTVTFEGATFGGPANFAEATFERSLDASGTAFGDDARFMKAVFEDETTFEGARFEGPADFAATEFLATANMHEDDANFRAAVFEAEANFAQSRFEHATFTRTTFDAGATFSHVVFNGSATFRPRTSDGDATLLSFDRAVVGGGVLGQTDDSVAFYDFTGGEIDDVRLDDSHCAYPLFDHFRFCNTDFVGFDFSAHKAHLARNNWVLHEFAADASLLPEGETATITDPATLENTYMKAKKCAKADGDTKAAAEFFLREMTYRRKKHWHVAFGSDDGDDTRSRRDVDVATIASDLNDRTRITTRLKAFGKWAGNTTLYQTCGYGERLWRIVYISTIAVVFWGILYTLTASTATETGTLQGIDDAGHLASVDGLFVIAENLYFSTATFITLEYVGSPSSELTRWLASLEAYFGALLIALVVFVLGRRVAR